MGFDLIEFGHHQYWRYRKSQSVGLFTDLKLYYEALVIARNVGVLNVSILEKFLPERVIGLRYIENFRRSTFVDLIRELARFSFVVKKLTDYVLTSEGAQLIVYYDSFQEKYYEVLLEKMNYEYGIPGWFVNRLWTVNPRGQGQVVIPLPIKVWKPEKRKWEDNHWDDELKNVTLATYVQINKKLPGAFPMDEDLWLNKVRLEYLRLGGRIRRRVAKNNTSKDRRMEYFAPRGRLTMAMKTVAVKYLFSNKSFEDDRVDFIMSKADSSLLSSRTFMVWCPRLEALELIYYSDYFEEIPGRLIFPSSVFGFDKDLKLFQPIRYIESPRGEVLFRHAPKWRDYRADFLETLMLCYNSVYNKDGVIYVSLQQVRDEVCRLLRISASRFEQFLTESFKESIRGGVEFSIALETDIREDQKSGSQIQRRPVFVDGVPHSLIAIKSFSK